MNLVVKGAARPDGSQPEPLITPNPSSPQTPHHRGRQPTRHRRHQRRLRRTIQSNASARIRRHRQTLRTRRRHTTTPVLPPSNTRCRHVPPTNSDRHQPHHRRQPQHPLLHPVAKTRTHRRSPRPLHQHRLRRTIRLAPSRPHPPPQPRRTHPLTQRQNEMWPRQPSKRQQNRRLDKWLSRGPRLIAGPYPLRMVERMVERNSSSAAIHMPSNTLASCEHRPNPSSTSRGMAMRMTLNDGARIRVALMPNANTYETQKLRTFPSLRSSLTASPWSDPFAATAGQAHMCEAGA